MYTHYRLEVVWGDTHSTPGSIVKLCCFHRDRFSQPVVFHGLNFGTMRYSGGRSYQNRRWTLKAHLPRMCINRFYVCLICSPGNNALEGNLFQKTGGQHHAQTRGKIPQVPWRSPGEAARNKCRPLSPATKASFSHDATPTFASPRGGG